MRHKYFWRRPGPHHVAAATKEDRNFQRALPFRAVQEVRVLRISQGSKERVPGWDKEAQIHGTETSGTNSIQSDSDWIECRLTFVLCQNNADNSVRKGCMARRIGWHGPAVVAQLLWVTKKYEDILAQSGYNLGVLFLPA